MFHCGQTMYVFEKNLDCVCKATLAREIAIASVWMRIWDKGLGKAGGTMTAKRLTARFGWMLALGVGLAGCASPGPPLPPSLKLPEVVSSGLTATRVGDEVRLHWTTPART